jgi:hypothetical protein
VQLHYRGCISAAVQTQVDPHKAALWQALHSKLDSLAGSAAAAATGGSGARQTHSPSRPGAQPEQQRYGQQPWQQQQQEGEGGVGGTDEGSGLGRQDVGDGSEGQQEGDEEGSSGQSGSHSSSGSGSRRGSDGGEEGAQEGRRAVVQSGGHQVGLLRCLRGCWQAGGATGMRGAATHLQENEVAATTPVPAAAGVAAGNRGCAPWLPCPPSAALEQSKCIQPTSDRLTCIQPTPDRVTVYVLQGPGRLLRAMLPLRRAAATKVAAVAEGVAASLSRQPVSLVLEVTELAGLLRVWLPPPPSNRWDAVCGMHSYYYCYYYYY